MAQFVISASTDIRLKDVLATLYIGHFDTVYGSHLYSLVEKDDAFFTAL